MVRGWGGVPEQRRPQEGGPGFHPGSDSGPSTSRGMRRMWLELRCSLHSGRCGAGETRSSGLEEAGSLVKGAQAGNWAGLGLMHTPLCAVGQPSL